MELLRPQSFIDFHGIAVGRALPMDIEELQIQGLATVNAIEPCPTIALGEGSVVTGRFVTREIQLVATATILGPDGTIETLSGTPIHPIWSIDQQTWIPLGDLAKGERLQAADGIATVQTLSVKPCAQPVYNLEIHGEHVYEVRQFGILVHNSGDCALAVNLNANSAVSRFGIYEIEVNGALFKIGKADLNRVTSSSGLPTRLHQQVRKLREVFGMENVVGRVVQDLGKVTTAAAKVSEHTRIVQSFRSTGYIPLGNLKSFNL